MEEIIALLENLWIDKEKDRELYYRVKKKLPEISRFFYEKVGWNIIVTEQLIKLEKLPATPEKYMGIERFQEKLDYCILCALMIYLEDREDERQFDLQKLVEELPHILREDIELDWSQHIQRKSLVRVLLYAQEIGLIKKYDGKVEAFTTDERADVLYEKTELAQYFTIVEKGFEETLEDDQGRGRTNRVYRKLLTTPAIYWEENIDRDSIYIRQEREAIKSTLKKFTGGVLEVKRNSAFLLFEKELGEMYPKKNMLGEIALIVSGEIRELLEAEKLKVMDSGDFILIERGEFFQILREIKESSGINWSKEYRDMSLEKTFEQLLEFMREWQLLEIIEDKIKLYPTIGKYTGYYRR